MAKLLTDINIAVIEQKMQRYATVGDWMTPNDTTLVVWVTDLGSNDSNFLLAIHEQVEAFLCRKHGISQEQVDDFDMKFKGDGEPGEAQDCPYKWQHQSAEAVERVLAEILGVDWGYYQIQIERALEGKK